MPDGGMLFTVMPTGPYSRASDLVSERSAALGRGVVRHATVNPRWALDDEIITMRPQPASTMSGTAT